MTLGSQLVLWARREPASLEVLLWTQRPRLKSPKISRLAEFMEMGTVKHAFKGVMTWAKVTSLVCRF